MSFNRLLSTTILGTHRTCEGSIVEMELEQLVVKQTADCLCEEDDCEYQHEVSSYATFYYIGCTGDCAAICSASIYPYGEQPGPGRFNLPFKESNAS